MKITEVETYAEFDGAWNADTLPHRLNAATVT